MSILTQNERATIKQSIIDLLDEFDYEYSSHAIDKIIDTWSENKSTLIQAFKNHPNYIDGKFLIAFDVDYQRDIDTEGIYRFARYLRRIIPEMVDLLPDDVKEQKAMYQYLPTVMYDFVYYCVDDFRARTINERDAEQINSAFPNIKARDGEKTTRVINKICTYLNYNKHPEYNREFAKYADSLTPLTITRHTIISLNPLDYLTMSFGNSWASCHTIDKTNKRGMPNTYEGQYSSGTVSYMLDGTSMVLYTVGSEYDGTDYYTQPKINRQMYHYGEDKLVQGRLYPQNNDGNGEQYTQYRHIVQEVIATCFNFPNLWIKKSGCVGDYVRSHGTHYRDYTCFDSCNISIRKDVENNTDIHIGHNPICIECGSEHDEETNINCCRCGYICADCGCTVLYDDAHYIDGEYYCDDCVTWCDECNEYHLNSDVTWLERYDRYVCYDCLSEYYTRCDNCGEYRRNSIIHDVRVNGEYRDICEDCLGDYDFCDRCEEYFTPDRIKEHGYDYLCLECYEIVTMEEMTEQEENA